MSRLILILLFYHSAHCATDLSQTGEAFVMVANILAFVVILAGLIVLISYAPRTRRLFVSLKPRKSGEEAGATERSRYDQQTQSEDSTKQTPTLKTNQDSSRLIGETYGRMITDEEQRRQAKEADMARRLSEMEQQRQKLEDEVFEAKMKAVQLEGRRQANEADMARKLTEMEQERHKLEYEVFEAKLKTAQLEGRRKAEEEERFHEEELRRRHEEDERKISRIAEEARRKVEEEHRQIREAEKAKWEAEKDARKRAEDKAREQIGKARRRKHSDDISTSDIDEASDPSGVSSEHVRFAVFEE